MNQLCRRLESQPSWITRMARLRLSDTVVQPTFSRESSLSGRPTNAVSGLLALAQPLREVGYGERPAQEIPLGEVTAQLA